MWTLLIYCLIHSFLDIVEKNRNPFFFFKIGESLPFLYINLKWRAKFQISPLGLLITTLIGWILYSIQDTITRLCYLSKKRGSSINWSGYPPFWSSQLRLFSSSTFQNFYQFHVWSYITITNHEVFNDIFCLKRKWRQPSFQSFLVITA